MDNGFFFNLEKCTVLDLWHKSSDGNKNELFFLLKINVDLSYAKLVKLLIVFWRGGISQLLYLGTRNDFEWMICRNFLILKAFRPQQLRFYDGEHIK